METFQPSAVALQCGSDSLSGDRLGCFNLTIKGESTAQCLCQTGITDIIRFLWKVCSSYAKGCDLLPHCFCCRTCQVCGVCKKF